MKTENKKIEDLKKLINILVDLKENSWLNEVNETLVLEETNKPSIIKSYFCIANGNICGGCSIEEAEAMSCKLGLNWLRKKFFLAYIEHKKDGFRVNTEREDGVGWRFKKKDTELESITYAIERTLELEKEREEKTKWYWCEDLNVLEVKFPQATNCCPVCGHPLRQRSDLHCDNESTCPKCKITINSSLFWDRASGSKEVVQKFHKVIEIFQERIRRLENNEC